MRIQVHKFSRWEEFETWWILRGDLTLDLITYYAVCCTVGLVQGWGLGNVIVGYLNI